MGASAFGYQIAKQFGINVLPTDAALVPFLLEPKDLEPLSDIPGISADAIVKTGKTTFRENILVTHKGLSGPAILQISNYWKEGAVVEIDLLPGKNLADLIEGWRKNFPSEMLLNLLNPYFTKSFVRNRIEKTVGNKRISEYSKVEIQKLIEVFQHWKIIPSGTEGYTIAEVTRGGVDTNEISSQTFESKKVKGLFFVGEVLDVTGWLGGYNFQWAWSSGFCAGQAV
jgi:predicted Rossmann fold flavoprotein